MPTDRTKKSRLTKSQLLKLIAYAVFFNGALNIGQSLLSHLVLRRSAQTEDIRISVAVITGFSLIYLSLLLSRRKHNAWLVALLVYGLLLANNLIVTLSIIARDGHVGLYHLAWAVLLPSFLVTLLVYYRKDFNVKSDIESFALALRTTVVVLLIAFLYGLIGMQLLDKRDFHQEISWVQAAHYTVDQFGLTTDRVLTAYTKRGRVFLYSLSLVSVTSLAYAALAFFQPIRVRLSDQSHNRQFIEELLRRHEASSEDFFKLWPHDKNYLLSDDKQAGLAYHTERGVALSVGDIIGEPEAANRLLRQFHQLCRTNDWLPVFVHTDPKWSNFYKQHGYSLQKIGEEAIIDINTFMNQTVKSKYFRQIANKFNKLEFKTEILLPPHKPAVIARLKDINYDWLKGDGRAERGFMMGYFSEVYLQQCTLIVARDSAGTIQAFLNQIPSFDKGEANFDMLRQAAGSPGNINDYVLMNFISYLNELNMPRLNLGLSPLAGLEDETGDSVINNLLGYAYNYGNRFYSFSGLNRFKAKYEPEWQDRYIAYKGGLRGFSRALNALNRAMSRSPKRLDS